MAKRNKKAKAKRVVAAASAPRDAMKITDMAIAHARQKAQPVERVEVFRLPQHPAGVKPAQMAMDDVFGGIQTWANGFGSYIDNGITFLGFAQLAELAQRPEYRAMTETIATEMTRRWISFTSVSGDDDGKADRIKEIEAEFKRLKVRELFGKVTEHDGFFGRGHIFIDTGDTDNDAEQMLPIGDGWDSLSKAKVNLRKPIKALRAIEPVWCYPAGYNTSDPRKDNWYKPDSWLIMGKRTHASRMLTFIAREVPDMLKPTYSFGGLSMSQMAKPYVDNWIKTRDGVNDIINSFSQFVLKTNMAQNLTPDGDQLFKRVALFNLYRSNQGTMVIDNDTEDFQNVAAPISGLEGLQAQAQEHLASVSHIPTVKLLGVQPAGLNADSEGVMRSFYDWINASQEQQYRPQLQTLMGLVMLSLWGEVDPDINFKFEPLWTLDEKGEAEVRKMEAETGQILIEAGVVSPEEERQRIASDHGSGYQSLDVNDVPDLAAEEDDGLVIPGEGGLADRGDNVDKIGDRLFGKAAA